MKMLCDPAAFVSLAADMSSPAMMDFISFQQKVKTRSFTFKLLLGGQFLTAAGK